MLAVATLAQGTRAGAPPPWSSRHDGSAASMQKTTEELIIALEATDGLTGAAYQAEAWAGEPFLRPGEDPEQVLAPETARRAALDEALAEIESRLPAPSREWKIRFALMLGLERVLSEHPPLLASGTELRRHQIDALAGMLTELIAAAQAEGRYDNGNGDGAAPRLEVVEPDDDEDEEPSEEDGDELPPAASDPGAVRRYRFRHPTASGKTIAA